MILEKRLFKGYSGRARIASGTLALLCAVILSSHWIPATARTHLLGWGIVLGLALLLNYGALVFSFVYNPAFQRNLLMMKPAIDAVPPLAIGGVFSLALIHLGQHNLLFGTWMTLYGLAHTACRYSLPRANYFVGLFYLASGTVCLISPVVSFINPWPMGIVFFTGELVGGLILIANRSDLLHGKILKE
jgi:hypothetical protein